MIRFCVCCRGATGAKVRSVLGRGIGTKDNDDGNRKNSLSLSYCGSHISMSIPMNGLCT